MKKNNATLIRYTGKRGLLSKVVFDDSIELKNAQTIHFSFDTDVELRCGQRKRIMVDYEPLIME